jgi:hypothetical protein
MAPQDKRQFKRIGFVDSVLVTAEGLEGDEVNSWQTQCLDISMRGILLQRPSDMPASIGSPYEVELMLAEDIQILMPCTVVHAEDHHLGLRIEMMSIDSLTNLRRLLELNLADSDEIERELNALIA